MWKMAPLFKFDATDPQIWLEAPHNQMPEWKIRVFPTDGNWDDIKYAFVYEPPLGSLKKTRQI